MHVKYPTVISIVNLINIAFLMDYPPVCPHRTWNGDSASRGAVVSLPADPEDGAVVYFRCRGGRAARRPVSCWYRAGEGRLAWNENTLQIYLIFCFRETRMLLFSLKVVLKYVLISWSVAKFKLAFRFLYEVHSYCRNIIYNYCHLQALFYNEDFGNI